MSAKVRYLIDTHAFLWASLDDRKLGTKVRRLLTNTADGEIGLCDSSLMEIGHLIHNDKITLPGRPGDYLASMLSHVSVLPTSVEAAILAPALPLPQGDPFDRIIVATAKTLGIPLLTRDAAIAASGLVKVVW